MCTLYTIIIIIIHWYLQTRSITDQECSKKVLRVDITPFLVSYGDRESFTCAHDIQSKVCCACIPFLVKIHSQGTITLFIYYYCKVASTSQVVKLQSQ